MQAIILSGGLGTRLQTITRGAPKALAEIAGKPFVDYQLEYLQSQGFSEFYFALGHKSEEVLKYLRDNYCDVFFSIERGPLGTGGSVKLAIQRFEKQLHDNVFVINGDSLINADFSEFLHFHEYHDSSITIGLAEMDNAGRYGSVGVMNNEIISFSEKKNKDTGLINSGVYILNKKCSRFFPQNEAFSMEEDFFPSMIGKGLMGFKMKCTYFVDMGTSKGFNNLLTRIKQRGRWH